MFAYKIAVIILSGILAAVLFGILINYMSARFRALSEKPEGASNQKSVRLNPALPKNLGKGGVNPALPNDNSWKSWVKVLSENPNSAPSRMIKAAIAFLMLLFFQLILGKFLFALLAAIASFIITGMYFQSKINKRIERFENQLIEGLGTITNAVRSGQSLLQALEYMVKESEPPISTEFGEALTQIKLGKPVNEALLEITKRVNSKNLRITVTSINIARETGGNLGEILTQLAETMRERKRIQGKVAALTAQGRASGVIMGCVPFFLLAVLYLMEPQMIGLLFTNMIGNMLLVLAVVMISIGMFFINKIVSIDI